MSELKAKHVVDVYDEYSANPTNEAQVYLKSEADKVIAELEERIADGDKDFEIAYHQNERLLQIVRHQKYKRCLAMAKNCDASMAYFGEFYDDASKQMVAHYYKWQGRWLELAKKFKETK